jgi:hypothetical protein
MFPIAAILGAQDASLRFERASQRLLEAASGVGDHDAAKAVTEQMRAKAQFAASLATIRAADRMTARLLDILA